MFRIDFFCAIIMSTQRARRNGRFITKAEAFKNPNGVIWITVNEADAAEKRKKTYAKRKRDGAYRSSAKKIKIDTVMGPKVPATPNLRSSPAQVPIQNIPTIAPISAVEPLRLQPIVLMHDVRLCNDCRVGCECVMMSDSIYVYKVVVRHFPLPIPTIRHI